MRKFWVAAVLALAMVGPATISVAPASASTPVHVVCVTSDWQHWRTGIHPNDCALHMRRACWCHAGFALLENLHWSNWGRHHARGRGRETYNGGVTVKQHVLVSRPQWGWTPWSGEVKFFSRAKIRNRF